MPRRSAGKSSQRGATLLEVLVALPVVLITISLFASMLITGTQMRAGSRDSWLAGSAAQDAIEMMRNEDFREAFLLYNADPFDDPGGPGTAPGNSFAVPGLKVRDTDLDGMAGEILMPCWNAGTELSPDWRVREDIPDADFGTPRDLNGDSIIDASNHAADYSFLPVIVRISWDGPGGERRFQLQTALAEQR